MIIINPISKYHGVIQIREGSLFINGGVRAEGGGVRKNATRFEGGRKKFRRVLGGGRKKIIFFIFQLEANKLFVL